MLSRFNRPAKRLGFLALCLGVVLTAVAFTGFLDVGRYGSSPFEVFFDRLSQGPFRAYRSWGSEHRGWAAFLGWVGLILTAGGALFAFAYDLLITPLISWVRTGKTNPRQ